MASQQNTGVAGRTSVMDQNSQQGRKVKILTKTSFSSGFETVYNEYPLDVLTHFSAPMYEHFMNPRRFTDYVAILSSCKAAVDMVLLWVLALANGKEVDQYIELVPFEMALEGLMVASAFEIGVLVAALEHRVRKDIVGQLPFDDIKTLFERFETNWPFRALAAETIAAGIIVGEVRDWEVLREYYGQNKEFEKELDRALQGHGGQKEGGGS